MISSWNIRFDSTANVPVTFHLFFRFLSFVVHRPSASLCLFKHRFVWHTLWTETKLWSATFSASRLNVLTRHFIRLLNTLTRFETVSVDHVSCACFAKRFISKFDANLKTIFHFLVSLGSYPKAVRVQFARSASCCCTMAFINVAEWTPENVAQWLQGNYCLLIYYYYFFASLLRTAQGRICFCFFCINQLF